MMGQVRTAFSTILLFAWSLAKAGNSPAEDASFEGFSTTNLFQYKRCEAAFNNGVLFSPIAPAHDRPTINYTLSEVQLGYMLSDVKGAGWWRGNVELAAAGFGGAVYQGPGGYVAGGTLWLRYNFVPPGWRVIPYVQGGAGVTSTDIDHEIVGEPFNFNLDLAAGARCFIARRWALSLEYRYQHISNANISNKNLGINAHGPILGVSFLF
jgi:opacity protein-like surface antigen